MLYVSVCGTCIQLLSVTLRDHMLRPKAGAALGSAPGVHPHRARLQHRGQTAITYTTLYTNNMAL